jgi:hypothetical protein
MLLPDLRRKNVFEFVSELAQLVETASGRVTFERVYGTAHAAYNFLVRGMSLKLEPRLVERLQQLIRALEEERAKLRVAIFGRLAQEFASTR